jgi:predicted YcjX-like family ATPase
MLKFAKLGEHPPVHDMSDMKEPSLTSLLVDYPLSFLLDLPFITFDYSLPSAVELLTVK